MEPLPDLSTLSDDELDRLLRQRDADEDAISKRRRLLHGRIDILRGERTARLKAQVAAGVVVDLPAPTSLDRPLYAGTGAELSVDDDLAPLPDLATFSDDDLRTMIRELEHEEDDISLTRRFYQGQADIMRAERAKRSRGGGGHVDPDDLGDILGGRPDGAA